MATKLISPNATLVPSRSRMKAYTTLFGKFGMMFEIGVFDMAGKMIKDKDGKPYDGGLWQYVKLDNGGFFMFPDYPADQLRPDGKLRVTYSENYFDDYMSPEAAGLGICILALNHMARESQNQQLATLWEKLDDYYRDHPEAGKVRGLID
jgi:ABC-type transporter lipoprotein component MlaA